MTSLTRRSLLAMAGAAPLAGLATSVSTPSGWLNVSPRELIRKQYFPDVTLKTHLGKSVRLYEDLIKDKFVVINFMLVNCVDGTCPITTYNLKMVRDLLKDRVGKDIFMYSITLDPERDSPEALKVYAEVHGAGPGWTYLRAGVRETALLRRSLGFSDRDPKADANTSNHLTMVRFGNEPRQVWGATSGLISPRSMAKSILSADWPNAPKPLLAPAPDEYRIRRPPTPAPQ